jgi:hypothetical protein
MFTSYEHDRQWFTLHPSIHQYQRAPFTQEWPDLSVPAQAVVTVHLINTRCTVRVLGVPDGPRLAEELDTDHTRAVLPIAPARPVLPTPPIAPSAWHVGQSARVAFEYAGKRRCLRCHIRTVHPTRIEVELRAVGMRFWVAPADLQPDLAARVEVAG